MKLVVDTNILFSYFFESSVIKKILLSKNLDLYSPEYALEELNNHKEEIISKTKINSKSFDN